MKRIIVLAAAAVLVSIMICGCAKTAVPAPEQETVEEEETAAGKKIVINDEKPSETVERVPEEMPPKEETKGVPATETYAASGAPAAAKSPATLEAPAAPDGASSAQAPAGDALAATDAPSVPAETKAEGDIVSKDFSEYAGKYTRTEDGSTLELSKDGKVKISIIRLTEMDGKAEGIYKNIIMITVKDANDTDMKLEFLTDTNELVVTDSKWSLLPNGETFRFDRKD